MFSILNSYYMDVLASEIDTHSLGHAVCRRQGPVRNLEGSNIERTGHMARQIRKTSTESRPDKKAYMLCKDYDNNSRNYEEIQLGDDKLNTVTTLKYFGSIFDSNGGAESDINNRVKLAWMKLKQMTGVLCNKKVPIELKEKVYKR